MAFVYGWEDIITSMISLTFNLFNKLIEELINDANLP